MNWLDALTSDGFVILEDVVPAARVESLRSAFADVGAGYGRRNILHELPAVAQLSEELRPLLAQALGPDAFAARGLFFDKLPVQIEFASGPLPQGLRWAAQSLGRTPEAQST